MLSISLWCYGMTCVSSLCNLYALGMDEKLRFWKDNLPDWYSFTKEKSSIYMTHQFCKVFRNIWKGPQLPSYGQGFPNCLIFKICILAVSFNKSQRMHLVSLVSSLTTWLGGHLVHRTLFTLLIWEYGGEISGGGMLRCSNNSSNAWWWECLLAAQWGFHFEIIQKLGTREVHELVSMASVTIAGSLYLIPGDLTFTA